MRLSRCHKKWIHNKAFQTFRLTCWQTTERNSHTETRLHRMWSWNWPVKVSDVIPAVSHPEDARISGGLENAPTPAPAVTNRTNTSWNHQQEETQLEKMELGWKETPVALSGELHPCVLKLPIQTRMRLSCPSHVSPHSTARPGKWSRAFTWNTAHYVCV